MSFNPENGSFEHSNWDKSAVIKLLASILPDNCILHRQSQLGPYECDGLSAYKKVPKLVLLPETIDQCQQIVRFCNARDIPLIARGAGTGLAGGVLPIEQAIIMSLAKFNQIKKIDPELRIAILEPGVRNLAISEAVDQFGLFYAPDPSSQIACTIGGNVAENSGGVHSLKYGLTVNNVLGIKIIDCDGEIIEIGGGVLRSVSVVFVAIMINLRLGWQVPSCGWRPRSRCSESVGDGAGRAIGPVSFSYSPTYAVVRWE